MSTETAAACRQLAAAGKGGRHTRRTPPAGKQKMCHKGKVPVDGVNPHKLGLSNFSSPIVRQERLSQREQPWTLPHSPEGRQCDHLVRTIKSPVVFVSEYRPFTVTAVTLSMGGEGVQSDVYGIRKRVGC